MTEVKGVIVRSSLCPAWVSIRAADGSNVKSALTDAGFQPGDRIVIVREPGRAFPIHGGGSIPWSVAEDAYVAYAARYGDSQSLERLAERGGFGLGELDELVPGWRETDQLKGDVRRLRLLLETLLAEAEKAPDAE